MVKKNLEKLISLDEKKLIHKKPRRKKPRYEKPILNKTISIRFLINGKPGNGDTDGLFHPGS